MWGAFLKKRNYTGKRPRRWPIYLAGSVLFVVALIFFLQSVVAHRTPPFVPDYPRVNLSEILKRPYPSTADYETIYLQTGLSKSAVDDLRAQGPVGLAQLMSIQDSFWTISEPLCKQLFFRFTMEDRMVDETGKSVYGPLLPVLQNGDVLVTYATHSLGWRHGHAGVVVDAAQGITLEAAVIGSDAQYMDVNHWREYSSFLVLRLKDITPEQQTEVAQYCIDSLHGAPYHISSGLFGAKAPDSDSALFGVQCSYLVWYAYQHFGYDVDGDGGGLVTVNDLASSPLFEIVQIYGMDPREWGN